MPNGLFPAFQTLRHLTTVPKSENCDALDAFTSYSTARTPYREPVLHLPGALGSRAAHSGASRLILAWLTFLVLYLCLDVVDGVAAFNLQRYRLPGQGLHEYLHGCELKLARFSGS